MAKPKYRKDIEQFLGMVTFLAKFILNLSQHTEPLCQLTRDDSKRQWQEKHQQALTKLKCLLTETPILRYFDVNEPVTVYVDVYKSGLRAVLLQED